MYKVISSLYNMTLRADHNTGAQGFEYVPKGTTMIADEIWTASINLWKPINGIEVKINSEADKWAHIVEVNGAAKDAWTAVIHNGLKYCDVTDIEPMLPVEPAETFPEYFILESPAGERKRYDRSTL